MKSMFDGLKIGSLGFVIWVCGCLIAVNGYWFGWVFAVIGFVLHLVGFVIHARMFFRRLARRK